MEFASSPCARDDSSLLPTHACFLINDYKAILENGFNKINFDNKFNDKVCILFTMFTFSVQLIHW